MRYVTDLLAVKPDEIQHKNGADVVRIIPVREVARDDYVLVVHPNGVFNWYTPNGCSCVNPEMSFIYKPRTVRYLKALHKILSENPHSFNEEGGVTIKLASGDVDFYCQQFHAFDGTVPAKGKGWPEAFIEEREAT